MSTPRRLAWLIGSLILGHSTSLYAADIAAAATGTSTNGFKPLVKDDRPATPTLAPASNEGEVRIKQFKLTPGLKVDLWAAEPMLANPVAFSVDEKGRVFTSETYRYRTSVLDIRHYMFMLEDDLASRSLEDRLAQIRKWFGPEGEKALGSETEVIRLLEDTNGDHKADKSSIFADGLNSPLDGIASGVLARHGEVWFTDIPSLWRFAPIPSAKSDSRPPSPRPSPPGRGGKSDSLSGKDASPTTGSGLAPSNNRGQAQTSAPTVNETRPQPAPSPGGEGRGEGGPASRSAGIASTPRVMDGYQAAELLRGFGVRFSFTGHDLHGLKFGPDGRLYFSCGDRGTHIVTQEGTVIDLPDEGAVFRCEPDGSNLEVVHRGLRNPQELAFNEYGDLFTADNDSDQGDRERWVQVIEGADSGWRVGHQHAPLGNAGMWNLERLWVPHFEGQAAYLMPPIANLGDGPSGLVYDYGTSLPEELKGRFLLAYFKGTSAKSGIYSLKVRPAGAGYELVGHDEFVWNSLVPDVDLTPDGAILFADWHEGWPKSNKGRLYRAYFPGVIADPVVQETAKLLGEGFAKRSEKELLGLLAHRDMRVRQEAQFELAARGPKSLKGLRLTAYKASNQFARLHALWATGQIARKEKDPSDPFHTPVTNGIPEDLLKLAPLLADSDTEVRAQAARVLGEAHLKNVVTALSDLRNDPSFRVRYHALSAFPYQDSLGDRVFVGPLSDLLNNLAKEVKIPELTKSPVRLNEATGFVGVGTSGYQIELPGADKALNSAFEVKDPILFHAAVVALDRVSDSAVEASSWGGEHVRGESSRQRRLAAMLALRRRLSWPVDDSGAAIPVLFLKRSVDDFESVLDFLSDPDPLLVLEAARAINDVPITNALPALAALAEPTKLDALLKQFGSVVGRAASPASSAGSLPAAASAANGLAARSTASGQRPDLLAIRDVRADQPLPWTNAPIDHLTPMLLRVVNANFRVGTAETAQRLASLATRTDLPELIRTEALFALGTWAKPHQRDRIVGTYRPLPERDAHPAKEALGKVLPAVLTRSSRRQEAPSSSAENYSQSLVTSAATSEGILIAATEAVANLKLTDATPRLVAVVKDAAAPATARAAALRAFAQIENRKSEIENLLALASQDSAEPLRLAASKLSAELNPNDAVGKLTAKLTAGSLAEQQSAFASLGDLKSDAADAILAEWLDKLMKREVANEVMLDLVEAAAKRSAGAVKSRLETYGKWKLPQDHLTPYREALFGGDAARGRKIFYENPAVACTRCHHVGNDGGGNAGPVLDGLASRVTREHLLESIVFPNQQVVQGFATALISLKNGTDYAGIVKSETDSELTILSPEEGEQKLKKADIASRTTGLSGMPEGLGQLLSRQELRDVIEFLGMLK